MTEEFLDDINFIIQRIQIGNKLKHKKILVSGGAGFLGSWICEVLIKIGADVICVDNLSSGKYENIQNLHKESNFKFLEQDVQKLSVNESLDGVLHFASRASPEDYHNNQVDTLLTNSLGTKNVLDIALKNKCICLVASTSEIYGDSLEIPTKEDYWGNVNPIGERSCYDEGKRFGEALCTAYKREFDLDVRIIRIFNTYGPKIRADGAYGRALPRFVNSALNDEKITIFGDGSQTRSFCYVSDTISGALRYFTTNENIGVVNIGNNYEITINELTKKIISKTNSNSEVIHIDASPDDPQRRQADITKAKTKLNWEPKITLDDGLSKTINWFRCFNKK